MIFKCRPWVFSLVLHEKWRRTGARQNVLKHCVWMTFVTQFNYFKKSIDSIFYSTPQIFEEIMALRHSLLSFKQVGCHCFLFIFSLPLYYVYELPLWKGDNTTSWPLSYHNYSNAYKSNMTLKVVSSCSIIDSQDVT